MFATAPNAALKLKWNECDSDGAQRYSPCH